MDFTHRPDASSRDNSRGLRAKRLRAYFFFCASIAGVSSKQCTLPMTPLVLAIKSLGEEVEVKERGRRRILREECEEEEG